MHAFQNGIFVPKLQAWCDRQRDISGTEKDLRAVACANAGKYRKAEVCSQQNGCYGSAGSGRF